MLYDKKWDSQVKPVEPSLKGIIAWLETKDPKEGYNYCSPFCAMGQYLQAIDRLDLAHNINFSGISSRSTTLKARTLVNCSTT